MRPTRILVVLLVGLATALPSRVLAHEGEEELSAKTLVEQAIALIRGQADQREAIEDKIHHALEAEDAKGVDLDLLAEADEAFEAGRLHEAQDLLEESIGAAPHRVVESPNPGPGLPAPEPTGPEPSPVLHERALEGGDQEIGGGPFLLGLAVVLAALGLVVARRVR